ncbi:DUF5009 domain-containing protein [Galbibacter pacificus]|uniref:DUF5009 domain-containing protein n=1 Tax=Galbibacter pacificus TaxID=2996052 RepID=A0ABT6FPM2_9FLAO|nr:DUF5009 domain-containing protein [Galbibacter pacificus]MDG3582321.1 DUF5009 domain-containing protein [Galbibacter pacificus]MDG3585203.1 DUF5009 domain-containing protein [Galbibacter pacificus]
MNAKNFNRILAIDIMRGITLFLMLFVNDLYEPGVPKWMVHTKATEDAMGLADWVFPGFLFMVGLSIPFAFMSRQKKGEGTAKLLWHIVVRTLSLLLIGVLMVNIHRLNPELAGINQNLWAILVYVSIFLIWNTYPNSKYYNIVFKALKLIGVIGLIILAFIFKAGTPNDPQWLITSWWGILGLIGWGYFATSVTYLLAKGSFVKVSLIWVLFIALNVLSLLGLLTFLDGIALYFGVLVSGNVPSIVICGLLIGMILKKYKLQPDKLFKILLPFGILVLASGFVLRNWFIISKIQGTPSWAMICNGISILVFCVLFFIIDYLKLIKWSAIFKPAGQNSLTTYLAPDIIYFTIWGLGLNILFYKQEESVLLAVLGSVVWAFAMIGFAALLSKINIKLKL